MIEATKFIGQSWPIRIDDLRCVGRFALDFLPILASSSAAPVAALVREVSEQFSGLKKIWTVMYPEESEESTNLTKATRFTV
jgi:hypothetical protein